MYGLARKHAFHALNIAMNFGYIKADELDAMVEIMLSLPPAPLVVNIGAGAGTSGLCFMESRKDTILHTIDIENRDVPTGSLLGEQHAFEHAGMWQMEHHYQHHAPSHEMPHWFIERNLNPDLIFLDGNHSYQNCLEDLTDWWPLLKVGGYMLVHDYNSNFWGEVVKAVDDFSEKHGKEIGETKVVNTLLIMKKVAQEPAKETTENKVQTQKKRGRIPKNKRS